MSELSVAAAREPRPEAQVFEPPIQSGDGIEVDGSQMAWPSLLCKKKCFCVTLNMLEGEARGIPHLAKNERDVGHPALVAGIELKPSVR